MADEKAPPHDEGQHGGQDGSCAGLILDMIDPLADKLLTSAAFISLVQMGLAPAWMVAVIIGREFAVTGLRSLSFSRGVPIPASSLGKIKMVAQVVAILALILSSAGNLPDALWWIGQAALWLVLVAAMVSAADYFRRFSPFARTDVIRDDRVA